MKKIPVGISACLLGKNVRYNGEHKLAPHLKNTLNDNIRWVPVCPEVGCGLGVPREPMQLKGDSDNPRLITVETGMDHTGLMLKWSGDRARELKALGLCGFILKCRSPSCAVSDAPMIRPDGSSGPTVPGLFARTVIEVIPDAPLEDEETLLDDIRKKIFLEKILECGRLRSVRS